jgi:hypothetical protein
MIINTPTPGDDSGAVGIAFLKTTGPVLASNNTLWANRAQSYDYGWDGGAFEIYAANGVSISGNRMWNNENVLETGTDSSLPCSNNSFVRNVAWGAPTQGRSFGMFLRCGQNMRIANNTLTNFDMGIFGISTSSGYSGSIDGLQIVNNVTAITAGKVYGIDTVIPSSVVIDHNLDYVSQGAYIGSMYGHGSTSSLSIFTAWSGYEANGLNADPLFVNGSGGDYRLSSGSPAVDRGILLSGVTDGYTGNAPDLGRYER